ncbi:gamma carbonic anhydrase family protein [Edwardsiella tarda]
MSFSIRPYLSFTPQLGERVFVDANSSVIGQVELGDDVSIWPQVVIRGDVNRIVVGARSNIQDGTVIHVGHCTESNPLGHPTLIGHEVTVGHKAMLHGCTIGNRVLVGIGAIVLDGAQIEDEVILGAGSLVPPGKCLTSGYLYFGNPVRQVRPLTSEERVRLRESATNYVKWKEDYLTQAAIHTQP